MKLVVISPESQEHREAAVLHSLFAAGLARYHLRKPSWSSADLESWLGNFSAEERSRIVIHSHHSLAESYGLGGVHERDEGTVRAEGGASTGIVRTRACHDLDGLRGALGRYHAVLLSPIFPSISKSGYAPNGRIDLAELNKTLAQRTPDQRRTTVFALGGIDASTTPVCAEIGFDGVAVLGAVWNSDDPLKAFEKLRVVAESHRTTQRVATSTGWESPIERYGVRSLRDRVERRHSMIGAPVMCLTQDGLEISHVEQARELCAAGARWIQLRMKEVQFDAWLRTAREVARICREHKAIFVVNDNVEVALETEADGVHLGKTDMDWSEARKRIGPDRILGGTVNNSVDAQRACAAGCLDYVGVGPWRFTVNKKNLAPVLGREGVARLVSELGDLPAWVIGGIEPQDLPSIRGTGAAGVAVSSYLYRANRLKPNFAEFHSTWAAGTFVPDLRSVTTL